MYIIHRISGIIYFDLDQRVTQNHDKGALSNVFALKHTNSIEVNCMRRFMRLIIGSGVSVNSCTSLVL